MIEAADSLRVLSTVLHVPVLCCYFESTFRNYEQLVFSTALLELY